MKKSIVHLYVLFSIQRFFIYQNRSSVSHTVTTALLDRWNAELFVCSVSNFVRRIIFLLLISDYVYRLNIGAVDTWILALMIHT
jgi:hypothetical protein